MGRDALKIYTAGPWADRPHVREIAQKLRDAGHEVTSRWLEVEDVLDDDPRRDEYLRQQAIHDLEDVIEADGLVYVNSRLSEGKATELGFAMATLKPVIIIGDRRNNVFLHLELPAFPTIDDAIVWMNAPIDEIDVAPAE